jgi:lipopolysaccharide export system permease protein
MQIIDRYLLRQFIQTFLICFLSLVGLFIVFDLCTNLETFLDCGKKSGNTLQFIGHYYIYKTILFFDQTSNMLAMVAAMFTVSWIQRHQEMTALMAAGVSRFRVLLPIIIAVGVISLLSATNREILVARYRHELLRRPQDPMGERPQSLEPRYDGHTNVLLDGHYSLAGTQQIKEPCFRMPTRSSLADYDRELTAESASYLGAAGLYHGQSWHDAQLAMRHSKHAPFDFSALDKDNHPSGYLLEAVRRPKDLNSRPSKCLDGEPVLITPHDVPQWLKPTQCFLVSDVDFDHLTDGPRLKQFSSTLQMIKDLRNPSLDFGADVRVAIHSRLLQPFLDMTLLFLGLPLVVTRESRNVFIAMAICMAVTVAFMLVEIGARSLGEMVWLTPSLAAWLPLIIFVPVAIGMSELMWK